MSTPTVTLAIGLLLIGMAGATVSTSSLAAPAATVQALGGLACLHVGNEWRASR